MKSVNPYLIFDGNAKEAFDYYKSIFGGEFFGSIPYSHFGASMNVQDEDRDRIAHISMPLGEQNMLLASDTTSRGSVKVGDNVQLMLTPESAEETRSTFAALSQGGEVKMELQPTEWAELYGECVDRFGVYWLFNYAGNVQFSMSGG